MKRILFFLIVIFGFMSNMKAQTPNDITIPIQFSSFYIGDIESDNYQKPTELYCSKSGTLYINQGKTLLYSIYPHTYSIEKKGEDYYIKGDLIIGDPLRGKTKTVSNIYINIDHSHDTHGYIAILYGQSLLLMRVDKMLSERALYRIQNSN